jgi:hypothetical protein
MRSRFLISLLRWVDSEAGAAHVPPGDGNQVEWLRIIPFVILHGMCLGVIWVGWSWVAVATASVLYFVRMFAITGFYHRFFPTRPTGRTASGSSSSLFSEARRFNAGPCGGRPTTATITASQIRMKTLIRPAGKASGGATSAG